jgi:hypothetical protein
MSGVRDLFENSMGQNGFNYISDTSKSSAPLGYVYFAIHALTDAVLSAYTTEAIIGGNTFTGVTIPAGTIIYGRFVSITLTSGSVIAYKGV